MSVKKNGRPRSLVHGVGFNDSEGRVYWQEYNTEGVKVVVKCPYYSKWESMLGRVHKPHYDGGDTYNNCTIQESWYTFSNFKNWVDLQPCRDWIGKDLDKDLLIKGNKEYSEGLCVFLTPAINIFMIDCGKSRGDCLLGVSLTHNKSKPFRADCNDPLKRTKGTYIGYYETEEEAHNAWKVKKNQYARELAALETDERVINALRTRYN